MNELETRGIWIDINIGNNQDNPEFTTRKILIWPGRYGLRTLQEYFLQYKLDITHTILLRLTEAIKELNGIDTYRQAELKIKEKQNHDLERMQKRQKTYPDCK